MRLQAAFPQAVLLVEGEPRYVAEDAWRGAVCRLVEDGFTVLHSLVPRVMGGQMSERLRPMTTASALECAPSLR